MSIEDITKLENAATVRFGSNVTAEEVEGLFAYFARDHPLEVRYSIDFSKEVGKRFVPPNESEKYARSQITSMDIKGNIADRMATLHFNCLRSRIDLGDAEIIRFYGLKFDTFGRDRLNEVPAAELELMQQVRLSTKQYFSRLSQREDSDEPIY